MSERIVEEEVAEDRLRLFFRTNKRKVKEKIQQRQVKKYGAYNKKEQPIMKQF